MSETEKKKNLQNGHQIKIKIFGLEWKLTVAKKKQKINIQIY